MRKNFFACDIVFRIDFEKLFKFQNGEREESKIVVYLGND